MKNVRIIYTHKKSEEEVKQSLNKLLNKFFNELIEKRPDIDYNTYFNENCYNKHKEG